MDLRGFLAENAVKINREKLVVSPRFMEDETAIEWTISCITARENNEIRETCYKNILSAKNGEETRVLDSSLYQSKLCAACVIFPDLSDVSLQNSYGVHTKEELLTAMLLPAEFENLSTKILEINGFKNENNLVVEAKN